MGNGSATVCDTGAPPMGGGIPGVKPNFDEQMITDALNDFGCRFQVFTAGSACTLTDASGLEKPISPLASFQFCDPVSAIAAFPVGDSIVTVQLRDTAGHLGPPVQIVVRVATPTPKP